MEDNALLHCKAHHCHRRSTLRCRRLESKITLRLSRRASATAHCRRFCGLHWALSLNRTKPLGVAACTQERTLIAQTHTNTTAPRERQKKKMWVSHLLTQSLSVLKACPRCKLQFPVELYTQNLEPMSTNLRRSTTKLQLRSVCAQQPFSFRSAAVVNIKNPSVCFRHGDSPPYPCVEVQAF